MIKGLRWMAAGGTVLALGAAPSAWAAAQHPGCDHRTAAQCVELALSAMGGRPVLQAITSVRLDTLDHTALAEQSYRQAPFLTSYDRTITTIDFAAHRLAQEQQSWWPENDPGAEAAESKSTLVASDAAAVIRANGADAPAPLYAVSDARDSFAPGPERLLLTAAAAPDLHFEPAKTLRSTPHSVVAFRCNGHAVKLLLNAYNHLPDAVDSVRPFSDFWFAWGDVGQRVYYDNWKLIDGVLYPTNRMEERNGIALNSSQVLEAKFNVALDDKLFAMDAAVAAKSAQSKGWNRPFDDSHSVALAPGLDLYRGSWNVTVIRQDDGVRVLEAPISPNFAAGVFDKARGGSAGHPGAAIRAVLSTSDSWPHIAGVREAVAEGLPVYILDLNRPLLERLAAAPHTLEPDRLQRQPRAARWRIVSGKLALGSGANRMELYPLRGAATERQYMVYFPEHKLLYASDTVVYDADQHTLYDPELAHEVVQAVEREHLAVDTVYAMHQAPMPWSEVTQAVEQALKTRSG